MSETVHGTAVLVGAAGLLIRGASGSGKSLLAAALISRGGTLIADDRVHLSACHGRVIAAAVGSASGMIELRGRGVLSFPCERSAVVRLLVDITRGEKLERLPADEELSAPLLGVPLPRQTVPGDLPRALILVDAALGEVTRQRDVGLRSSAV